MPVPVTPIERSFGRFTVRVEVRLAPHQVSDISGKRGEHATECFQYILAIASDATCVVWETKNKRRRKGLDLQELLRSVKPGQKLKAGHIERALSANAQPKRKAKRDWHLHFELGEKKCEDGDGERRTWLLEVEIVVGSITFPVTLDGVRRAAPRLGLHRSGLVREVASHLRVCAKHFPQLIDVAARLDDEYAAARANERTVNFSEQELSDLDTISVGDFI